MKKELAIKTTTSNEFRRLMKYFNKAGLSLANGDRPIDWQYSENIYAVSYEQRTFIYNYDDLKNYEPISFSNFAALVGIEVEKGEVVVELNSTRSAKIFDNKIEFWDGDKWDFSVKPDVIVSIHSALCRLQGEEI